MEPFKTPFWGAPLSGVRPNTPSPQNQRLSFPSGSQGMHPPNQFQRPRPYHINRNRSQSHSPDNFQQSSPKSFERFSSQNPFLQDSHRKFSSDNPYQTNTGSNNSTPNSRSFNQSSPQSYNSDNFSKSFFQQPSPSSMRGIRFSPFSTPSRNNSPTFQTPSPVRFLNRPNNYKRPFGNRQRNLRNPGGRDNISYYINSGMLEDPWMNLPATPLTTTS